MLTATAIATLYKKNASISGAEVGCQGGPLMHVIAVKAVAFGEALEPAFKDYARAVVDNARPLSSALLAGGFDIVSGDTDSHIVLLDLMRREVGALCERFPIYRTAAESALV